MARRNIATGIDIGTSRVRVIVAEFVKEKAAPVIIGIGEAEARGMRHGYVINTAEAADSIREAVEAAEKKANVKIKKAFIAVGGISVESETSSGSVFVSRADNEITAADIAAAAEAAMEHIANRMHNKSVIHEIPVSYKIDGKEIPGRPEGMIGSRLEVQVLFITCLSQHLGDFTRAVEEADIAVIDVMASPIAASFATLTKRQKTAGCVLANIGAETLSVAVFENGIPVSLKIFPIGGTAITNDIALGFKIPLEEAEDLKRGSSIGAYPKKKLEEIIHARLSDIFDLINAHLKKIGRSGLLPAGIILTGGSSSLPSIADLARATLNIPSRIASPDFSKTTKDQLKDAQWAVAYGLCVMGIDGEGEGDGMRIARQGKNKILSWVRQFLP